MHKLILNYYHVTCKIHFSKIVILYNNIQFKEKLNDTVSIKIRNCDFKYCYFKRINIDV